MNMQERIGRYWSARAAETSEFRVAELAGPSRKVWLEFIKSHLPEMDPKDIKALDCATGSGFYAFLLKDLGCDVTGVDYSDKMIEEALENNKKLHYPPIDFRQMDAQDMSFEDETFDFIISRNMTWTVPDPGKVYSEWFRLLKPGGIVVNIDANYGYVFKLADDTGWTEKQNEKWGKDGKEMIGTRPDMIRERNDISKELYIAKEDRPGWDLFTMLKCGFSEVRAETDIYGKLFPEFAAMTKNHGAGDKLEFPEDAPDTRIFCVSGVKSGEGEN